MTCSFMDATQTKIVNGFLFIFEQAATAFVNYRNVKNFDLSSIERKLKISKNNSPWNAKLFNQIGNFWRIKGNAAKAIDCFRAAIIIEPTNSDVLHDLARVLYTLQYLDDAVFLLRRSLEDQPNNPHSWRPYFTLGEIYRSYGQFQQSLFYFRKAIELNPDHEPTQRAIRDMQQTSPPRIEFYTILIICLLVSVQNKIINIVLQVVKSF